MIYSDLLTAYYSGKRILFAELTSHEKYTWKFLTFLDKYYLKPWDWDSSWTLPHVLTPKMLRDLENKEMLEPLIYENQKEDKKETKTSVHKGQYFDTTGLTDSQIQHNQKMIEAIPPQDRGIVLRQSKLMDAKDEKGNLKPIKTKEDLADLLGTDSSNFEMVDE